MDGRGSGQGSDKAHIYAILNHPDVEYSNIVIICTILVYDHIASVLSDPGFIFFYVSMKLSFSWDIDSEYLYTSMYLSTSVTVLYMWIK